MNFKTLALVIAICLCLASCSSHKKSELPYFEDLAMAGELPEMSYLSTIKPDDELFISVNAEQPQAAAAYNLPLTNPAMTDEISKSTAPKAQTYLVDSKGYINFPVLGLIHVAGLTVEQLRDELTKRISKDVADPIVNVLLLDFKVVVAGEVLTPKTVEVKNNRITLLEAIAEAGDLTPYGERDNVLVIREENGKRVYARINLNDTEVLTSPYYYLRPNDYVYVSPNKIRQDNSKYNQNNAFKLSVISTIVSACSVVASLVIALAVK